MKRTIAALAGIGLLAGCPYDATEAGLQAADGGVIIPFAGLDGGFYLPTGGSNSIRPLRAVPPRETLCMLVIGDYGNHSDYPRWIGSYLGDVRAMWFLGEPNQDGIYISQDDASLRYTYQRPNSKLPQGAETVSLQLRFEKIPSFDLHSDVKPHDVDGEQHGSPLNQPYFLSDIQVQGDIDGAGKNFLDCWDWQQRESSYAHFTPCANCVMANRDYTPCDIGQPDGFKLENCFK